MFPSFTAEPFGGIQVSGREAWKSISGVPGVDATVFFQEPGRSKVTNAARAWRARSDAGIVLVWHLGLLKLVPFLASSSRRRLAVFLHGIEAWRKQDAATSYFLRRTDLFLSNSDFTWNRFKSFHPECAQIMHRTVHLGLGEAVCAQTDPPGDSPCAVMLGRMRKSEDYKGHREMIRVWPRVLSCLPDAELRIVGDGDLRPELQDLALRTGVGDRVRFYGAIPDEEKEKLLREARALIMPSAGEGFGLVYLEAMRMGRPCLVSLVDAGIEVVNPPEAGLGVDLSNPEKTTDCVLRLLTPGADWEAMAGRARRRYEQRFTASQFRQRLATALLTT